MDHATMQLQQMPRQAERRWSDAPYSSYSTYGQQLVSSRRFSTAPIHMQQMQQMQPAYLLASPAAPHGSSVTATMLSDFPVTAPSTSPAQPQGDVLAREHARQDLLALERAAELRRADLVALDQRVSGSMGAPTWGIIQPHQFSGSLSSQAAQHQHLQQAGFVSSFPPSAVLPDRIALEEARRRAEEEAWLQRQGYGSQQP